jgi:hypothetical protein
LSDSYTNVNLDGYNFIQNCRRGRAGAGVGLYLDNSMMFKMRDDLSLDSLEHVESLFVEICRYVVFCVSYYDSLKEEKNKYTVYRDKSKTNLIIFQNQLNETVWENFPGYNDPKMAYDSFFNEFTSIYDSSFPLKKIKSSKLNSRKPWVTNGLLKSIKRKNKLYRKYLSFPTAQNETLYKACKNKLTKLLKNANDFITRLSLNV